MNLLDAFQSLIRHQTFTDGLLGTWFVVGLGFVASLTFCIFLVLTKSWHGIFSMDENEGVQKVHSKPTPRIGGVAIFAALLLCWLNAPEDLKPLIGSFLLAGLPAFIFGFAEDITKRVSVLLRLLATMASGFLAWLLTDHALTRVDVWGIDYLLTFTLVSILFTSFAVGGLANSINIIDGFNGLASITSALGFTFFALIAYQVGDIQLTAISLVFASCVWGFFCVNWPFGKIFLGDGGSYFVGFGLAWLAVMLIDRNPQVSAFAALLICIYPVTEVVFTIYRRQIKLLHPGHPDRLHFHSLIKRRFVRSFFLGTSLNWRNSITGLLVGSITFTSGVLANLFYQSVLISSITVLTLMLVYVSIYARIIRFKWCSPIKFLFFKPMGSFKVKS
jgi:UDP-N-acetylmuramyl pentapeptide phosphotransferase/UDP-N-acetylglucosamine-1-phosphate transferase